MGERRRLPALVLYLLGSAVVSCLLHLPVHGTLSNALIPATVPWVIGVTAGLWAYLTGRPFGLAWAIMLGACIFFLFPHVFHHG